VFPKRGLSNARLYTGYVSIRLSPGTLPPVTEVVKLNEMKRILITGMSGTGKSSVLELLSDRGFTTVETDFDDWSEQVERDGEREWLWREERMHELLNQLLTTPLVVSGCCANQGKFYDYFDYKILFSAPLEVILERVARRSSNPYGSSEADRREIAANYAFAQPLLQKSADYELDSSVMSVQEMASFVAKLAS